MTTKVIIVDHRETLHAIHKQLMVGGDEPKKDKKAKKDKQSVAEEPEIEGASIGTVVTDFTESTDSADPYAATVRNSYMIKQRKP